MSDSKEAIKDYESHIKKDSSVNLKKFPWPNNMQFEPQ